MDDVNDKINIGSTVIEFCRSELVGEAKDDPKVRAILQRVATLAVTALRPQ